jgi:hypothetical protein
LPEEGVDFGVSTTSDITELYLRAPVFNLLKLSDGGEKDILPNSRFP